jgi:hypothetical protein
MRSFFAVSLVAAAFVFTGCSVQSGTTTDDENAVGEADEALTAYGKSLIGAWSKIDGDVDLDKLVLRADGTFIWQHNIYCIKAPCPTRDEGKFIAYKPSSGSTQGRVRLIGKEFGTRQYSVTKGTDGTIKLGRYGASGKFENVQNWCQQPTDCAGQIQTVAVKCASGSKAVDVCTETNSCSKTCEPTVKPCVVSGCSGQICAESDMISTCEWREEYACYKTAICERGTDGTCGWRKTTELESCLLGGGTKCDFYADPTKRYVGTSPEACMTMRFLCEEGTHYFSDSCGCGCQND